jgi:secreted trypsin-like serine protease
MFKIPYFFLVTCMVTFYGVTNGTPQNEIHIVGGQPAVKNEFPYQVSIQRNGRHICGGAIVTETAILTAAHCIQIGEILEFLVVAGDHSLLNDDGTEQKRNVSKNVLHPEYDAWTVFNDVGILILNTPLTFNGAVSSIPLAPEGHLAVGVGLVSGWGSSDPEEDRISDILQKVGLPLTSDEVCREAYDPADIADSMLCAGFPSGGLDTCRGDTGDPLVCFDRPVPYLCGIFSWQHTNCGEPKFYSVYSEVSFFTEWISNTVF